MGSINEILFSEELINLINEEFIINSNEIKTSLELLDSAIQTTIDVIENKAYEFIIRDRDYNKAEKYRESSKELNKASIKIKEIADFFEEDGDYEEGIDDENINEKINYSDYIVDSEIQHNLYEDLTNKRPSAFEFRGQKIFIKEWKEMFIKTCELVAKIDKNKIMNFPNMSKMNGKKVMYFSKNINDIKRSPRKISDLELYVSTNHSSNQIRNIIINILKEYNIALSDFKIYLRADYSKIH